MTTDWNCSACTYTNSSQSVFCDICLTTRGGNGSATNSGSSNPTMMTPSLLFQMWKSYGRSGIAPVTKFSQPTLHGFSNYAKHAELPFVIPPYCNSAELSKSGRNNHITFGFAEKAIMACKAALFGDWLSFDRILQSGSAKEVKALGRRVTPFSQASWDAYQCSIVREVTIAKLVWPTFRSTLRCSGDTVIAECTVGDRVWGTALDFNDSNASYPYHWKGMNVLGWAIMEARDEMKKQPRQQQQQPQIIGSFVQPSAPSMTFVAPSAPTMPFSLGNAVASSAQKILFGSGSSSAPSALKNTSKNPNSIDYLAAQYRFGRNAFGPLQRSVPVNSTALRDLSSQVDYIIVSSFPKARHMKGERDKKDVTKMLTDIYSSGLFMHGDSDSSVNQTIIPSLRYIFSKLEKMAANDQKRVLMVTELADACQDCQQVQARVILRMYGDLTSQAETFDSQLKYSLTQSKEAALQIIITKYHSPECDLDHTKVRPDQQRAHLWSTYVTLVGDAFGLEGVDAARGDRYLQSDNIRDAHRLWNNNDQLKQKLLNELGQHICVKEWICSLIGDINNQSSNAERIIDRSCIFKWASDNMDGDFKHRIFYDEGRFEQYSDLVPRKPTDDNEYEPFLSPIVLVEMLVKAGMLEQKA
eukprot:CAMPEP_0194130500 /NCGR_PEP_ID=MMETSP0152-20130528/1530_1 /TAXON_ID=1049557 /ORGANISM="Thalassiothrix antarctica, Strain L6-D1" /LENGTH=640 /DNA_ID=CAMNT_0038825047 /DNA_START=119 /DNA_END=2041 /DNA_ORIENTATION=-